jgi:hypothetical protein
MATMTVFDSTGATQTVEKPLTPGRAAATASRPVVFSNEDNATIGALTETAPATDTASSGLNGRLQRIAQRLTSLIAQLPSALGQTTKSASLSVALASDDAAVTALGAQADSAATTDTGTFSLIALFKRAMGYWSTIATAAADTTTPSPVKIDQTTDGTTNRVNAVPGSTAHALIPAPSTYRLLSAAATTNGASIKGSAGTVKGIQGFNAKASAVYLKLYNKATSPTVGTDTPVKTLYLPASAAFAFDFGTGVAFATGIGIALTGAGADADTTALASGDILALNVDYH